MKKSKLKKKELDQVKLQVGNLELTWTAPELYCMGKDCDKMKENISFSLWLFTVWFKEVGCTTPNQKIRLVKITP